VVEQGAKCKCWKYQEASEGSYVVEGSVLAAAVTVQEQWAEGLHALVTPAWAVTID